MTPRNFGHQGKRDDQVTVPQLMAGLAVGLLLVCLLGAWFLHLAHKGTP